MWVSVIILSATLADVAVHEAGQFDVAFDEFDGDLGMMKAGRLACLTCRLAKDSVWRSCAPAVMPLSIMKVLWPACLVRVMTPQYSGRR